MLILSSPDNSKAHVSGTPPPQSGDWIITNETYVYDETIVLNGSIVVESGGKLTLENVTLKFNCTFDGQFNITVKSGGFLNITDSIITTLNSTCRYFITAFKGSQLYISGSHLSYAGYSLESDGLFSGLYVEAEHAEIRNNIIQNFKIGVTLKGAHHSTVDNNIILDTYRGIYLRNTNYANITNNYIFNAQENGIFPVCSNFLLISGNEVVKTTEGIWLQWVENSTISYNIVHNQTYGMNVWHVYNSTFLFNEFYYSTSYGLPFYDARNNTFIGNKVHDTPRAIWLYCSSGNLFYFNDFYNNSKHVYVVSDPPMNYWDNGTFGNYWDDYNGTDCDSNGIGDTPYVIDENNIDYHPLMYPFSNYISGPEITILNWGPKSPLNNETVTVNASVTDVNGIGKVLLFYSNDTVWHYLEMTYINGYYFGEIPPMQDGTTVRFKIFANDSLGNPSQTEIYSYIVRDIHPPTIQNIVFSPTEPTPDDNVTVNVEVEDPSSVEAVILIYTVDSITVNVTMSPINEKTYSGIIPAFPENTFVKFKIFANDSCGNYAISDEYSYTVRDITPPTISNVTYSPESPAEYEEVTVTVQVIDSSGILKVILTYIVDSVKTNITMQKLNETLYTAVIPGYQASIEVCFMIFANDTWGNYIYSETYCYTVADTTPPSICDVTWFPENPLPDQSVNVTVKVCDNVEVDTVILSYRVNGEISNITMVPLQGSMYYALIPPQCENVTVYFKIIANDTSGNLNETKEYFYTVSDITPPTISNVTWVPENPTPIDNVTVFADVFDISGIAEVILTYSCNHVWVNVTMNLAYNNTYYGVIPPMPVGTVVSFKIIALDTYGNVKISETYSYEVTVQVVPGNRDGSIAGSENNSTKESTSNSSNEDNFRIICSVITATSLVSITTGTVYIHRKRKILRSNQP